VSSSAKLQYMHRSLCESPLFSRRSAVHILSRTISHSNLGWSRGRRREQLLWRVR
jgi:hypothetical protein